MKKDKEFNFENNEISNKSESFYSGESFNVKDNKQAKESFQNNNEVNPLKVKEENNLKTDLWGEGDTYHKEEDKSERFKRVEKATNVTTKAVSTTLTTAAVVVVVVGGAAVLNETRKAPSRVEFQTVEVNRNTINYSLLISDEKEDEQDEDCFLDVVLCKNEEEITTKKYEKYGLYNDSFPGLEFDTTYTLNVYEDLYIDLLEKEAVATYTVRTEPEVVIPTSRLRLSEYTLNVNAESDFMLFAESDKEDAIITWEYDEKYVYSEEKESRSGEEMRFFAMEVGSTTITAKDNYGATAKCEVTIEPSQQESSVFVEPEYVDATINQSFTISAFSSDESDITWEYSDEYFISRVTTSASYEEVTFTPIKVSDEYQLIYATNADGKRTACHVTILDEQTPSTIEISTDTYNDAVVGQSFALSATSSDGSEIAWSFDQDYIDGSSTSASGEEVLFTPLQATVDTNTVITATNEDGESASCTVYISEPYTPATISLSAENIIIHQNDEFTISATSSDGSDITWSYDADYISARSTTSVSGEAMTFVPLQVTGQDAYTEIVAKNGDNQEATCRVTILEEETLPATIEISQESYDATVGETFRLSATSSDNSSITWSFSTDYFSSTASISESGEEVEFTPLIASDYPIPISATNADDQTAVCYVTINEGQPSLSVTLSTYEEHVYVDDVFTITATSSDGSTINWEFNSDLILLNRPSYTSESGEELTFTAFALSEEPVPIRAYISEEVEAICNVYIEEQPQPTIALDYEALNVNVNEDFTLSATTSDGSQVQWGFDQDYISSDVDMSESGDEVSFTPLKEGETTITATIFDSTISTSCTVNIIDNTIHQVNDVTWSYVISEDHENSALYSFSVDYQDDGNCWSNFRYEITTDGEVVDNNTLSALDETKTLDDFYSDPYSEYTFNLYATSTWSKDLQDGETSKEINIYTTSFNGVPLPYRLEDDNDGSLKFYFDDPNNHWNDFEVTFTPTNGVSSDVIVNIGNEDIEQTENEKCFVIDKTRLTELETYDVTIKATSMHPFDNGQQITVFTEEGYYVNSQTASIDSFTITRNFSNNIPTYTANLSYTDNNSSWSSLTLQIVKQGDGNVIYSDDVLNKSSFEITDLHNLFVESGISDTYDVTLTANNDTVYNTTMTPSGYGQDLYFNSDLLYFNYTDDLSKFTDFRLRLTDTTSGETNEYEGEASMTGTGVMTFNVPDYDQMITYTAEIYVTSSYELDLVDGNPKDGLLIYTTTLN